MAFRRKLAIVNVLDVRRKTYTLRYLFAQLSNIVLNSRKSRVILIFFIVSVNCADLLSNGFTMSGVYTICLSPVGFRTLDVFCDMETDGGGWLVSYPIYYY